MFQATPHIVEHTLSGLYQVYPGHQLSDCQSSKLIHLQTVGEILCVCHESTVHVALEDLEQLFSSVISFVLCHVVSSESHNRSQFGPGVVAFTELNNKEAPMHDAVGPIHSEPITNAVNTIKAIEGEAKPRSAVRQVSLQHFTVTSMVCEAPSRVPFNHFSYDGDPSLFQLTVGVKRHLHNNLLVPPRPCDNDRDLIHLLIPPWHTPQTHLKHQYSLSLKVSVLPCTRQRNQAQFCSTVGHWSSHIAHP